MLPKEKAMEAIEIMYEMFPSTECELKYKDPFELLIAVISSAQATNISVNKATSSLFAAFPTPEALATVPVEEIIAEIKTIGLYRNKAKNIKVCTQQLLERSNGEASQAGDELVSLPDMGGKTASVVMGDAFGESAFVVDTHVERVSKRPRIYKLNANVTEVEQASMYKVPRELWVETYRTMIFLGHYHYLARAPKREVYPLPYMCQEGKEQTKGK